MVVMTVNASGTDGIIKKIRETVGDGPVYLSIDVRALAVAVTFITLLSTLIKYT
jgi:agmatinase